MKKEQKNYEKVEEVDTSTQYHMSLRMIEVVSYLNESIKYGDIYLSDKKVLDFLERYVAFCRDLNNDKLVLLGECPFCRIDKRIVFKEDFDNDLYYHACKECMNKYKDNPFLMDTVCGLNRKNRDLRRKIDCLYHGLLPNKKDILDVDFMHSYKNTMGDGQ